MFSYVHKRKKGIIIALRKYADTEFTARLILRSLYMYSLVQNTVGLENEPTLENQA